MIKKESILFVHTLLIFGIILLSGCVTENAATITTTTIKENDFVVAKLMSITGGDFIESAGYYEGMLKFQNIQTNEEYSIFVCAKDWSWVEEGYCYKFSPSEVEENVDKHKYSAELSGCYVGTLEIINCQ